MVKPESRRGSPTGYSFPTMVEMFGLKRPLPAMMVARPRRKMVSFGIEIMNRPVAMMMAPSRIERW